MIAHRNIEDSSLISQRAFMRMTSVEELDSSLTLLSHLSPVLGKRTLSVDDSSSNSVSKASTRMIKPKHSLDMLISSQCSSDICGCFMRKVEKRSIPRLGFRTHCDSGIGESVSTSFDEGVPKTPVSSPVYIESSIFTRTTGGGAIGGTKVGAIDNKIEQAMDLVKTHLTFAVREEVEVLRATIGDLEAKVALLESQNQVLRQFAPADVVANLALLLQNGQHMQANTVTQPSTTTAALQPTHVAQQALASSSSVPMVSQYQQSNLTQVQVPLKHVPAKAVEEQALVADVPTNNLHQVETHSSHSAKDRVNVLTQGCATCGHYKDEMQP